MWVHNKKLWIIVNSVLVILFTVAVSWLAVTMVRFISFLGVI